MLKEKITIFDWIATFVAFCGILIIKNPFEAASFNNLSENLGVLTAFLGAVTGGITMTLIRKMGSDIHFLYSPFIFTVVNIFLCPIFRTIFLTIKP